MLMHTIGTVNTELSCTYWRKASRIQIEISIVVSWQKPSIYTSVPMIITSQCTLKTYMHKKTEQKTTTKVTELIDSCFCITFNFGHSLS